MVLKKEIVVIVTLLIGAVDVYCQTGLGYFSNQQHQGYVFPKETILTPITFNDASERYMPTKEEITRVEQLVKGQLKSINQPLLNQGGGCPILHNSLGKYLRQYVGYINQNGDKVIWINFVSKKDKGNAEQLDKQLINVLDGCSYYWNIKVNLTQKKLYNLQINGAA